MPPKKVYGKRTAVKAPSNFAKFLSPDKENVCVGKQGKNGAANRVKPKEKDDFDGIEKELEALTLREGGKAAHEAAGVVKKKRRPRRVVEDTDDGAEHEHQDAVVDIETNLGALTLEEDQRTLLKEEPQKNKGRPRKAIGNTGELAETKKKDHKIDTKPNKETSKPQKHPDAQSAPSSPMRGQRLKAVVIPKSSAVATCNECPKMPQLPTPDLTPERDDVCTAYVSPLLSLSYGRKIVTFEDWSSALEPHFTVSKIAEASFSEVYRLSATSVTPDSTDESVLKLVPLRRPPDAPLPSRSQPCGAKVSARQTMDHADREEQEQWKSHVEDVLSEVKLLQNLNHIPGFTNFRELTVLQGRPSITFANAWKAWNKSRPRGRKSEFPDPSKKPSYEDTQLWAVIEMQDAGTDCEKVMEAGGMGTIWEIWDVFWGVCLSVAKAEEACNFEHRDMHLENICVRSSRQSDDLIEPTIKDPLRRKLGFTGIETTVIDCTLSRADILPPSPCRRSSSSSFVSNSSASSTASPRIPTSPEPDVAYLDLNKDLGLFTGDATEEYQYEIYRYMRGVVFYGDPLKSELSSSNDPGTPRRSPRKINQHIRFDEAQTPRRSPRKSMTNRYRDPPSDIWKYFHPKTNLVWVHFILYKLLQHLEGYEPMNISSKQTMRNVDADPEDAGRIKKKACKLYRILERVAELVEPGVLAGRDSLGSMKELVVLAMEERWLRVEDVAG